MDENILLVEDDRAISEITAKGLEQAGYHVTAESDGRRSITRATRDSFDLIVLDVMLPSVDGFEVCRQVRAHSRIPIIMLTAKAETMDIVIGLEAGADDYVTKPFDMPELVARVRAALRRATVVGGQETLSARDLVIDPSGYKVTKKGAPVSLTATEFKLLTTLVRHRGQVLTREILLDLVWEYDYLGDSRVVDMAVKRLREKVEDDPGDPQLIQTVRGVGYRLEDA